MCMCLWGIRVYASVSCECRRSTFSVFFSITLDLFSEIMTLALSEPGAHG